MTNEANEQRVLVVRDENGVMYAIPEAVVEQWRVENDGDVQGFQSDFSGVGFNWAPFATFYGTETATSPSALGNPQSFSFSSALGTVNQSPSQGSGAGLLLV